MSKNITVLKKIIYICLQDQFTNKNTNGTWSNILVGLPHYWNSDPYHTQQVMMEVTAPGTHTYLSSCVWKINQFLTKMYLK